MGASGGNIYDPGYHRTVVNGASKWVESQPRFHSGTGSIDTTYGSVLGASDIADLHAAAVTSQAAFETQAASTLGSWWTGTVAACDAAGLTGGFHVKVALRQHYAQAVSIA